MVPPDRRHPHRGVGAVSASERLKALEARLAEYEPRAVNDLIAALPQIVAVVEAAEKTYMTKAIHDALAALEEALS